MIIDIASIFEQKSNVKILSGLKMFYPLKVSLSADVKKSRARSMKEYHVFVNHE